MIIRLDLTPWVRGPHSSVGLSAQLSFLHLQAAGVAVEGISKNRSSGSHANMRWLSPWRRGWGYSDSIVHTFDHSLSPMWRARRVMTVHDCWTLHENAWQAPEFQQRQSRRFAQALSRAHFVLTPSEHTRRQLIAWDARFADCSAVLPWGPMTRPETHAPVSDVREYPQLRPYLRGERPFLLYVACLEARKNHVFLAEALKNMKQADLICVGSRGYEAVQALRAMDALRASGTHVLHVPALDEAPLAQLYRQARVLLLTSHDEGFGLPALEGLCFGKAMCLSDIAPLREVAGGAATYVHPREGAEALRVECEKLLSDADYREQREQAARTRAQNFSWARYVQGLRAAYERVKA